MSSIIRYMIDMAQSITTITVCQQMSATMDEACDRLAVSKRLLASVIAGMMCGALDRVVSRGEAARAAEDKPVRGPKFTGTTVQVSLESSLGERLARHAKTLRISRAWLFHYSAEDIIERLEKIGQVEAPARMVHNVLVEDFPVTIAERLRNMRQEPREGGVDGQQVQPV